MASLSKTYTTQKLQGKVYTPQWVVTKMLNDLGYNTPNILGKTIIDPACGDGRFVCEIAKTIIRFSPPEQRQQHLEKIHAWDIDAEALADCRRQLNQIVEPLGITVHWNIKQQNALQTTDPMSFDFLIGNPPYIRIQHLPETERKYLQTHYQFCKNGSTDIYIAFYELAYRLLAPTGKAAFITPNTFFYTETAQIFRHFFVQQQAIQKITNFAHLQLFDNATTYSAIMVFGKTPQASFCYEHAQTHTDFLKRTIDIHSLTAQKIWQLQAEPPLPALPDGVPLKAICNIHVGITTLCDKAYIFPITPAHEGFVWAKTPFKGTILLESALFKPIIKASKLKNSNDPITEYVLFPYQKKQGKHQIIAESNLQTNYPLTYQYLLDIRPELDKRDNGKPNKTAWYAFGRSQGLDTSFGKKILFSPMNKQPNFVLSNNEICTFYSGYCIKYSGNYHYLLEQLNSTDLANYMAVSSRDFRGGWKAYNKRVVEEFVVKPERIDTKEH